MKHYFDIMRTRAMEQADQWQTVEELQDVIRSDMHTFVISLSMAPTTQDSATTTLSQAAIHDLTEKNLPIVARMIWEWRQQHDLLHQHMEEAQESEKQTQALVHQMHQQRAKRIQMWMGIVIGLCIGGLGVYWFIQSLIGYYNSI